MTIEQDELTELEVRLSARFETILAAHDAAVHHPDETHPDGSPKIHSRRIKVRIIAVVMAMGTFAGADHFIHLDWIGRTGEVFIAAFFDYWLNGAAKEGIMPKVNVPRRKPKE